MNRGRLFCAGMLGVSVAGLALSGCGHQQAAAPATTSFSEQQVRKTFASNEMPLGRTVRLTFAGVRQVPVLFEGGRPLVSLENGTIRVRSGPRYALLIFRDSGAARSVFSKPKIRAAFRENHEPTALRDNVALVAMEAIVPAGQNRVVWRRAMSALLGLGA
ncbi:MAG TPA: hypothetical protein VLU96_00210 [Gaiellaceae bacterium]|nr:hypothetical protein [Gaiellaceae bacterium]